MAKKRKLITRLLRWVWVPTVSFVIVVAVAMGCAVWSPVAKKSVEFGNAAYYEFGLPSSLRMYDAAYVRGSNRTGFGISFHRVMTGPSLPATGATSADVSHFYVGRAGFPFRCMRWTTKVEYRSPDWSMWERGIETKQTYGPWKRPRRIPLMPEPAGMALNVLIVSATMVLPRLAWRRAVVVRRRHKSLCIACAYPLGDFAICPECGKPMVAEA